MVFSIIFIDSPKAYAKRSEISLELNFYTKRLDDRTVVQLRRIVQRRININPIFDGEALARFKKRAISPQEFIDVY